MDLSNLDIMELLISFCWRILEGKSVKVRPNFLLCLCVVIKECKLGKIQILIFLVTLV